MLFCAVILLSLYVATAHSQDFVCGYGLGGDEVTAAAAKEIASSLRSSSTDPIYVLPLFGKFKDQDDPITLNKLKDRDGKETQSSENLLDLDHKGSLAHFFMRCRMGHCRWRSTKVTATCWERGLSRNQRIGIPISARHLQTPLQRQIVILRGRGSLL